MQSYLSSMFFAEIKPQIEQLSHDELLKTMAYLKHLLRAENPSYQRELAQRHADIEAGRGVSQQYMLGFQSGDLARPHTWPDSCEQAQREERHQAAAMLGFSVGHQLLRGGGGQSPRPAPAAPQPVRRNLNQRIF